MIDLIGAIRDQHRLILDLADDMLKKYEDSPVSRGAAVKAVDALVAAESRHEAAEAVFLWPVVRDRMPEYADLRAVAQTQEREARRRLHRLHKEAKSDGAPEWANQVVRDLLLHVRVEESHFLPVLPGVLDPRDSYRLGPKFVAMCRRGPTRPHPRTPDIPGALRMSAPLVARIDRVRDLFRMR